MRVCSSRLVSESASFLNHSPIHISPSVCVCVRRLGERKRVKLVNSKGHTGGREGVENRENREPSFSASCD